MTCLKTSNIKKLKWYKQKKKTMSSDLQQKFIKQSIKICLETVFMSTENSKRNKPHRFRITLADKLNLKDPNKNKELANLSISYTWKISNLHITRIDLKFLLQHGMLNLMCQMDHILFQTFKIILSTLSKIWNWGK